MRPGRAARRAQAAALHVELLRLATRAVRRRRAPSTSRAPRKRWARLTSTRSTPTCAATGAPTRTAGSCCARWRAPTPCCAKVPRLTSLGRALSHLHQSHVSELRRGTGELMLAAATAALARALRQASTTPASTTRCRPTSTGPTSRRPCTPTARSTRCPTARGRAAPPSYNTRSAQPAAGARRPPVSRQGAEDVRARVRTAGTTYLAACCPCTVSCWRPSRAWPCSSSRATWTASCPCWARGAGSGPWSCRSRRPGAPGRPPPVRPARAGLLRAVLLAVPAPL